MLQLVFFLATFASGEVLRMDQRYNMHPRHANQDLQCDLGGDEARFDCHPGPNSTPESCKARGCCWRNADPKNLSREIDVPYCYFPRNYEGYSIVDLSETPAGYQAMLTRPFPSGWPRDAPIVQLDVYLETRNRLRFKVLSV